MDLDQVVYVIDENLLRLGNGVAAVRRDTARFSRPPVHELLYAGILDPDWIPIVGDRGGVVIPSDKRLRTRRAEASLAITHKLKAVHLHGDIGTRPAWDQLVRLTSRWEAVERQTGMEGPWWLSLRRDRAVVLPYEPGAPERG
jgi:PIN like domain